MNILWQKTEFYCVQVYFSHHKPKLLEKEFPSNVIHKPDVEFFSQTSVCFKDETVQTLDAIIYCTGMYIVYLCQYIIYKHRHTILLKLIYGKTAEALLLLWLLLLIYSQKQNDLHTLCCIKARQSCWAYFLKNFLFQTKIFL